MARINPFSSITVLQGDQYLKVATINSLKSLVIVDFVIQINNQEIPTETTTSTTFRVAGVVTSTQAQLIASGRSDSIPSGSVHIWVVPSTSGIPGDLYDIYIESSSQISGYWEDLTSTGELVASTIQQVESLTGTKLQEFWNSPGVEAASKFSHPMVVVMDPTSISNSGYEYFADIVINRATVVVDLSIKVASIDNPSHWVEFLLKGTINNQGVIDLHAYSSSEIVGSKGIGYSGNTSDGKIKLWFQFDEYCVGFWTNNNPMSTITAVNELAVQNNPGITLVPTKYLIYKDLAIEQIDPNHPVTSVNGLQGIINLTGSDIEVSSTDTTLIADKFTTVEGLLSKLTTQVNTNGGVIIVSDYRGDDTNGTGSYTNPYKTIAKALQSPLNSTTILVEPGTYAEDVTIDNVTDLMIQGYATNQQYRCTVQSITVSGTSSNIGVRDLMVSGNVTCTQSGALEFNNVYVTGDLSTSSNSWMRLISCEIDGDFTVNTATYSYLQVFANGTITIASTGNLTLGYSINFNLSSLTNNGGTFKNLDIPAPPDQTGTYTLRSVAGVLTWQ